MSARYALYGFLWAIFLCPILLSIFQGHWTWYLGRREREGGSSSRSCTSDYFMPSFSHVWLVGLFLYMAVSEAIVSNFIKEKRSFLVICLLRTKLRERGVGYLFKGVTRVEHLFASCLVVMGGDILVVIVSINPL